jgi:hypothetical protein
MRRLLLPDFPVTGVVTPGNTIVAVVMNLTSETGTGNSCLGSTAIVQKESVDNY